MARLPRRDTIDESNVGVYHCINRCVRRAYLCGVDPVSGKNHDHRKAWIQQRLEFLAGIFAIDVIGFRERNQTPYFSGWFAADGLSDSSTEPLDK